MLRSSETKKEEVMSMALRRGVSAASPTVSNVIIKSNDEGGSVVRAQGPPIEALARTEHNPQRSERSTAGTAEGRTTSEPDASVETSAPLPEDNRTVGVLEAKWEHMFRKLLAYKDKFGNTLVPNRYRPDPSLGSWVSTQRRQYKAIQSGRGGSSRMNQERTRRLQAIGFVWETADPRHTPWESRFKELLAFKDKYGHTQVPIGFAENVKLANWVSTQRQEAKLRRQGRASRLTQERIEALDKIGFVWEAQRGGRRKRDERGKVLREPKPAIKRAPPSPDISEECLQRNRSTRQSQPKKQRKGEGRKSLLANAQSKVKKNATHQGGEAVATATAAARGEELPKSPLRRPTAEQIASITTREGQLPRTVPSSTTEVSRCTSEASLATLSTCSSQAQPPLLDAQSCLLSPPEAAAGSSLVLQRHDHPRSNNEPAAQRPLQALLSLERERNQVELTRQHRLLRILRVGAINTGAGFAPFVGSSVSPAALLMHNPLLLLNQGNASALIRNYASSAPNSPPILAPFAALEAMVAGNSQPPFDSLGLMGIPR